MISWLSTGVRAGLKQSFGTAGGLLGHGVGGAIGYQWGGAYASPGWGGVAENVAYGAAFDVALSVAGKAFWPAAIGYAAFTGAQIALEEGQKYYQQRTKLDISNGGVIDTFGKVATMRQRSLQAMQSSHLNMRSALGQEAFYMHR